MRNRSHRLDRPYLVSITSCMGRLVLSCLVVNALAKRLALSPNVSLRAMSGPMRSGESSMSRVIQKMIYLLNRDSNHLIFRRLEQYFIYPGEIQDPQ